MDKQNVNGYLTIGVLKNYIKDLSDDNKSAIIPTLSTGYL